VPKPITGGGGTTTTKASWIDDSFAVNAAAIDFADRSFVVRLSKSSSGKNTMPALELGVKPLTDMPLNCTACETPGCFMPISPILRITSSVRSRVAAGGSCAMAMMYCLSWSGMKPPGTAPNPK